MSDPFYPESDSEKVDRLEAELDRTRDEIRRASKVVDAVREWCNTDITDYQRQDQTELALIDALADYEMAAPVSDRGT